MKNYIDIIIPRGGKNLVKRVQGLSNVPIIGHLEGLCHTYVDKDANLEMANDIIYNAKLRNTSICGATETILIHENIVKKFCNPLLKKLEENSCKIYGDPNIKKYYMFKIYSKVLHRMLNDCVLDYKPPKRKVNQYHLHHIQNQFQYNLDDRTMIPLFLLETSIQL